MYGDEFLDKYTVAQRFQTEAVRLRGSGHLENCVPFGRREMLATSEYDCEEEPEFGYMSCSVGDCVWQLSVAFPSRPQNLSASGYVWGINGTLALRGVKMQSWVPIKILKEPDDC